MFQRNGQCGYVLKPNALRNMDNNTVIISKRTQHFFDVTVRDLALICMQMLRIRLRLFLRSSSPAYVIYRLSLCHPNR
jgi:hypothetical protein